MTSDLIQKLDQVSGITEWFAEQVRPDWQLKEIKKKQALSLLSSIRDELVNREKPGQSWRNVATDPPSGKSRKVLAMPHRADGPQDAFILTAREGKWLHFESGSFGELSSPPEKWMEIPSEVDTVDRDGPFDPEKAGLQFFRGGALSVEWKKEGFYLIRNRPDKCENKFLLYHKLGNITLKFWPSHFLALHLLAELDRRA